MKITFFICLMLYFWGPLRAKAQLVDNKEPYNIEIRSDSIVQLGKELQLSYICYLEDDKDEIVSPIWYWDKNNKDYKIIVGPIHSTLYSVSVSKSNGESSKNNGKVYTYVLSFNKEGVYSMPPMIATNKSGKLLKSKPFNVKVIKPTVESKKNSSKSLKEDFLEIVASVDKNRISLGDSIELVIKLYTKMFPPDISLSTPLSINNAYWDKKDSQFQSNIKAFEIVTYKGDTLVKAMTLAKYQVVPIQAGKLVVEPLSFNLTNTMKGNVDMIEKFYNNGKILRKDTVIMTKQITIQVDNL